MSYNYVHSYICHFFLTLYKGRLFVLSLFLLIHLEIIPCPLSSLSYNSFNLFHHFKVVIFWEIVLTNYVLHYNRCVVYQQYFLYVRITQLLKNLIFTYTVQSITNLHFLPTKHFYKAACYCETHYEIRLRYIILADYSVWMFCPWMFFPQCSKSRELVIPIRMFSDTSFRDHSTRDYDSLRPQSPYL